MRLTRPLLFAKFRTGEAWLARTSEATAKQSERQVRAKGISRRGNATLTLCLPKLHPAGDGASLNYYLFIVSIIF